MNKLNALLTNLRNDERGLSTVEYVVLLVLIVAMSVGLWNGFGGKVKEKLSGASKDFGTSVNSASDGTGTGTDTSAQ